jgi:predicted nucleic acid-binding protein
MSDRPFFDSTILIYAVSAADPRAAVAEQLLTAGGFISVQVLNEFVSVARRKLKMSWAEVNQALAAFRTLCRPAVPISLTTHETAVKIAAQSGYNIYDALILAAASESGCTVLYSEDMQHGHKLKGLTIRNPFAQKARN